MAKAVLNPFTGELQLINDSGSTPTSSTDYVFSNTFAGLFDVSEGPILVPYSESTTINENSGWDASSFSTDGKLYFVGTSGYKHNLYFSLSPAGDTPINLDVFLEVNGAGVTFSKVRDSASNFICAAWSVTLNNGDYIDLFMGGADSTAEFNNCVLTFFTDAGGGAPGPQGPTGPYGIQGVTGPQGYGETGLRGPTGVFGPQGDQGPQGIQGATGLDGLAGDQGVAGTQGATGLSGIQGATGLGTQGIQGETGLRGITGILGATGIQGIQGTQGGVGSQGVTGIGIIGATGVQGTNGTQGNTGVQGVAGNNGSNGSQGATGIQGITGLYVQGVTGVQGTTGPSGGGGTISSSEGYGTATVNFSSLGTYFLINPTMTIDTVSGDFSSSAVGRIRYDGSTTKNFHVIARVTFENAGQSTTPFRMRVSKTGTAVTKSLQGSLASGGLTGGATSSFITSMATNDYLEVFMEATTAGTTGSRPVTVHMTVIEVA